MAAGIAGGLSGRNRVAGFAAPEVRVQRWENAINPLTMRPILLDSVTAYATFLRAAKRRAEARKLEAYVRG
jgi:hypothetical protein